MTMPKYKNETLEKYLNDAASGIPAPGGGSVGALIGALATTMSSMAVNFTAGKEKYKQYEERLQKILEECEKSRETLLSLMQEDITAYTALDAAFKLPKSTENEKKQRSEAIQRTTLRAAEVPFQALKSCLFVLELTRELVDIANPNLMSEIGIAALLAYAGFQSAKLNVEINLIHLKRHDFVQKTRDEVAKSEKTAEAYFKEIWDKVQRKIHIHLN